MDDSVFRMQQEAAQRVQRMQEHARQLVREHPPAGRTAETLAAAKPPPPVIQPPKKPAPAPLSQKTSEKSDNWLSGLLEDKERLLLLMLAYLLIKNKAPQELIFALVYLAM